MKVLYLNSCGFVLMLIALAHDCQTVISDQFAIDVSN